MDDFDSLAPQFRRAKDRWPDAPTLAGHYQAVLASNSGNGYGLIGTCKSFIESVCLTILGEFGKSMPSSDPSTTEMLVEALKVLGLQNTKGASKFDKVLSAHNKLADALSEMRNHHDPVVHGKDGFLDILTANECRAFLITSDTILALLLAAHDGTEPDLQYTREPYDRFIHLHERVDRSVEVDAQIEDDEDRQMVVLNLRTNNLRDGIQLRVEPSRLLYAIDRTAYVELLASSVVASQPLVPIDEVTTPSDVPVEVVPAATPPDVTPEVVPAYEGILSPLKEILAQYLQSLGVDAMAEAANGANLRDSVLATAEQNMGLDWDTRETLQSAMKVALRRTLVQFGVARVLAEESAAHLLSWFKIQASSLGNQPA